MKLDFNRIEYAGLNSRQKENYNYHKLGAVLADFGYSAIRLSDDWNGADLVAPHVDGNVILKIQLKGRLTFKKSYKDKELCIAFPSGDDWYVYPHDTVLELILSQTDLMSGTSSWDDRGGYSFPSLSRQLTELLERYRIRGDAKAGEIDSED